MGKNFSSTCHIDEDVGFTIAMAFNAGEGAKTCFTFPQHEARILLSESTDVELFMFNSQIRHCSEVVSRQPGSDSYLFSLYTSQVVTRSVQ